MNRKNFIIKLSECFVHRMLRYIFLILTLFLPFEFAFGQMALGDSQKKSSTSYYDNEYLKAYHNWLLGFIQAWNEYYRKGITRLNTEPQQIGITPINGGLLLNETDLSMPGRGSGISIIRVYNSKIWSADSEQVANYDPKLKTPSWLGLGWDLHFGKIWAPDDSAKIFESNTGIHTYFKRKSGNLYVSIDGTFQSLKGDTLKTGDGTIMIFGFQLTSGEKYLTKLITSNGNTIHFFNNEVSTGDDNEYLNC
ncbi:MAG: hypothetical protein ABIL07_07315, partial [candidate division WOR-3 bacterium]